jgi:hypothetical protein
MLHRAGAETARQPLCWNRDVQAQALRVELTDGSFYVFPYDHLGLVKFEPQKDGDQVHVLVGRYEIQIAGRNLRELGLAFQKCAVDWVREMPARYDLDADGNQVWIKSVTVDEADE